MATFRSLYSGSSGNCSLIGENGHWICVDMGRSCRAAVTAMRGAGVDPVSLEGILVTHEHTDHVSALGVFLKSVHVPVYGTAGTLAFLAGHSLVPPGTVLCEVDEKVFEAGAFAVRAFRTNHDSADCCGYRIRTGSGSLMAIATDLGSVTPIVRAAFEGVGLAALEANYDAVMLRTGPYPYVLKQRIASPYGHLCNADSADMLGGLLRGGVGKYALCHLSRENNTPRLAEETVRRSFSACGAGEGDVQLWTLPRESVSQEIRF